MLTSSAARSRKGIPNPLSDLSGCRAVLCLLVMPVFAQAWQTTTPPIAACQAAGQIAGWDILDNTLSLSSDSGHYSDFRYDSSTVFTNGDAILRPDQLGILEALNLGDRLCVEAFRADSNETADRVRVTLRGDIDARDKRELIRWQSEGLFGTVKGLDQAAHRITVRVSASSDVSVDAAGPVALWILPAAAIEPSDIVRGNWESLAPGDAIYVRGERVTESPGMRASLIVSGGFRSFVGSIESMEIFTNVLQLRDFRSGRTRPVHFDFNSIYLVGKNSVPGAGERRLYPATVGDIREGDSVLLLGREKDQGGGLDAFLLITGFSPGGVLQPGPGQSEDWIFQAIGFGGSRL
jgi:hypothetical protein